MLNSLLSHFVTMPLRPTPDQAQALLRLSSAHRLAELFALDQASLAITGQDVSLAALAGGPDQPDRSPAGEAAALAATPLFRGCSAGILEDAIETYQARVRQCTVRSGDDLPGVSAFQSIAGTGLVRPAGPEILSIGGVGPVQVDVTDLHSWAHDALWCQPAPGEHTELVYSGSAYLEREWTGGDWLWTVVLDFAETC